MMKMLEEIFLPKNLRPGSEVARDRPNLESSLAPEVPDRGPSADAILDILPVDVFELRDIVLSVSTVALEVTPVIKKLPAWKDLQIFFQAPGSIASKSLAHLQAYR